MSHKLNAKTLILLLTLAVLIVLAGCNMPGVATKTNEEYVQEAMQTLQAKSTESYLATGIAQMTEIAKPATATSEAHTTKPPQVITVVATPEAQTTPPPQVITVVATPTKKVSVPTANVPQATATPKPVPCYRVGFVDDVTVPDGTVYAPGTPFNKIWRLKNTGTCTWDTRFDIAFESGDRMSAPKYGDLTEVIKPGEVVDFSVPMVAPSTEGKYVGKWMLVNPDGVRFGAGEEGKNPFWVAITVKGSSSKGEVFSFANRASEASWSTGAGSLKFPGKAGDYAKGYVLVDPAPKRETGGKDDEPGLITVPNKGGTIYIIGIYPDFAVKAGDVFQATLMCEGGATKCDVDMGLNYRIGSSGTMQNLALWDQSYDGKVTPVKVDLSPLAGKTVQFILAVRQGGSTEQMNALWLHPAIYRP